MEQKLASMGCHQTQIGADWPLHRAAPDVLADVLGQEYFLRAYPPVDNGTALPDDLFHGRFPED
jgi:hypothetical protein